MDSMCETTVRMLFEGPGLVYEVAATNNSSAEKTVDLSLDIPGCDGRGLAIACHRLSVK